MSEPMPWEEAFARNVKARRELLGWSQTELARRLSDRGLGFHQQQVARIESGTRPIRLNEAFLLAEVMGVEFAALVAAPDMDSAREGVVAALTLASARAVEVQASIQDHIRVMSETVDLIGDAARAYAAAVAQAGEAPDAALTDRIQEAFWFLRAAVATLPQFEALESIRKLVPIDAGGRDGE